MKFFYKFKLYFFNQIVFFNKILYFFILINILSFLFFLFKNLIIFCIVENTWYILMLSFHLFWIILFLLITFFILFNFFFLFFFFNKKNWEIYYFEFYSYIQFWIISATMLLFSGIWWSWFVWGWGIFYDLKIYLILLLIIFFEYFSKAFLNKEIGNGLTLLLLVLNLFTICLSLYFSSIWFNSLHQLQTSTIINIIFFDNVINTYYYGIIYIIVILVFFFFLNLKFYLKKNLIIFYYNFFYEMNFKF